MHGMYVSLSLPWAALRSSAGCACLPAAGTNYAVRARALAHAGWFPTYTVGEDYALGMELTQRHYKSAFIAEKLAAGEAPVGTRDVLRQRSRWAKGHMQVGGRQPVWSS